MATEPTRETDVENPIREEQRRAIRDELEGRLRHRGVTLTGSESDGDVLALSEAADAFERAVMRVGGDLMVDTPESSQPEHPEHVLPQRNGDESADAYARRLRQAAEGVGPLDG